MIKQSKTTSPQKLFDYDCVMLYIVPYPLGGVFKSVGEEYQVVKRGREYHGFGEEYNAEKSERGSNIIFPIILNAVWKNKEWGRGQKIQGRK